MFSLADQILDDSHEMECPHCQAPVAMTMRKVMNEEILTCSACNNQIQLVNNDKNATDYLKNSLRGLDDALNSLGR